MLVELAPKIPFMASIWIRFAFDKKVEVSVEAYQARAHFKALIKGILVAPSRILKNFFHFMYPCRAVLKK